MPFIPHTEQDIKEMLAVIGVSHIEDLFNEIPANLKINKLPSLPALSEMELARLMKDRAACDSGLQCYIGAGAYEHHIPAAVWEVASRGEFMTAYTPYQAEASQGTLQLLYEFQTMMASLMGLEVSNASLYDGASALAEAILMAVRLNKQIKPIFLPTNIHPHYREVVKTILKQQDLKIIDLPFDKQTGCLSLEQIKSTVKEASGILIIPQPNFFGLLEEVDDLTNWIHEQKGIAIALVNPMSMALLKPPGEWGANGADIACGEGQPLGVPLASGGPYYGFLCCKKEFVRQMPGRIIGRTVDVEGKQGFVLTLQAREQHIRRSKATSNICTNQGLLVTASTIYMSLLGPEGLRQVALACHHNAQLLKEKLSKIQKIKFLFNKTFFHELVVQLPVPVDAFIQELSQYHIQAGFSLKQAYPELGESLLICVTETKTEQDLALFADAFNKVLSDLLEKKSNGAVRKQYDEFNI